MPWVKAEYAGELAVVSAWIAALVPWSVSIQPSAPWSSFLVMLRWPFAELQIRDLAEITFDGEPAPVAADVAAVYPGTELGGSLYGTDPVTAATYYDATVLLYGGLAWLLGAAVVLVALVLAVAMYRDEAATADRLPADHVRVMAGLLGLAAAAFAVATGFYWLGRDVVGVPVPVGVVVVGALAIALARVERV